MREADRQMLVDFINTLEDIRPWEWREQSPWFWYYYVRWHISRADIYGAEISPQVGIEMEEANLQAVLTALEALYNFTAGRRFGIAGSTATPLARQARKTFGEVIAGLEALTDKQRRVLLEMIMLERG